MKKDQLRNATIYALKQLTPEQKGDINHQLHRHLMTSTFWKNATTIGITISKGFEWDTYELINQAWRQGKKICAPKCDPKFKTMNFYKFQTFKQLDEVYYHLLEPIPSKTVYIAPSTIDLLLVPGIVFDPDGYRIGFGGGYYDRFLAGFLNQTVSILHSSQLVPSIPKNTFDLPVQHLITEEGLVR